jgi:hypothetical protein
LWRLVKNFLRREGGAFSFQSAFEMSGELTGKSRFKCFGSCGGISAEMAGGKPGRCRRNVVIGRREAWLLPPSAAAGSRVSAALTDCAIAADTRERVAGNATQMQIRLNRHPTRRLRAGAKSVKGFCSGGGGVCRCNGCCTRGVRLSAKASNLAIVPRCKMVVS